MADVFDRAKRSQVMGRIRSANNKDTELFLVKFFRTHKITGWRRRLPVHGHPDFVFPRERLALFVDGCFWHLCPLHAVMPKSNRRFWRQKLLGNKKRDSTVTAELRRRGWRVLRIWEHELKASKQKVLFRKVTSALVKASSNRHDRNNSDSRCKRQKMSAANSRNCRLKRVGRN